MFNNRHIQIRFVKDNATPHKEIEASPSDPELPFDPEAVSKFIDENVKTIAAALIFVGGGLIVLKTGCKIVENLSNPANWK